MARDPRRNLPHRFSIFARSLYVAFMLLFAATVVCESAATAAEDGEYKAAGGLAVYLGVVRAEITKGQPSHSSAPPMHGRDPTGSHAYALNGGNGLTAVSIEKPVPALFEVGANSEVPF